MITSVAMSQNWKQKSWWGQVFQILALIQNTVPTSYVQHKIIHKSSSWKRGEILLMFVQIVENQTPNLWKTMYPLSQKLGYYYKYITKGALCVVVPHMYILQRSDKQQQ
jgi:hypothetical protein